ncbi:YbbR-like domain-containing protein [candidate division KSB1 bacterium]|nr:YbbR-like domain-containing protein [candidate division KSB1 bacterium]RQV99920.1 MAG: YbbR-like domain-containing protein [candidate division KSB1 bacterium]
MALNRNIIQKDKNFWKQHKIKIASSLIAVFIWFLVVTKDSYEYKTTIPIEISQENPNFVITSSVPTKAHIILQGTGRNLFSYMLFREGRLRLDVEWSSGTQIIRPTAEDIYRQGNAKKLTIRQFLGPDSIQIKIEKLLTKNIPVRNNISLKPQAGYKIIGDIIVEPESVRVQGPESAVAELDSIDTQTLLLENLKFPIQDDFSLKSPENKHVTLLDTRVTIAAEIQRLLEKVIDQVPISVKYLPQNLEATIQPPFLSVKVQGGEQSIYPLDANDIYAFVEYRPGLDSMLTDVPVQIEPIPGVKFRDIDSERVKITFIRNPDQ